MILTQSEYSQSESLDGTKVYIHPDRTYKESQEDWQLRNAKKQFEKEGKKVLRRRNTLSVDGIMYEWCNKDNKLVTRVNNINAKRFFSDRMPMDTTSLQENN